MCLAVQCIVIKRSTCNIYTYRLTVSKSCCRCSSRWSYPAEVVPARICICTRSCYTAACSSVPDCYGLRSVWSLIVAGIEINSKRLLIDCIKRNIICRHFQACKGGCRVLICVPTDECPAALCCRRSEVNGCAVSNIIGCLCCTCTAVGCVVISYLILIYLPLRPKLSVAWRHFCTFGIGCTRTVLSRVPSCEGIACSFNIGKWTYALTRKLNLIYRVGRWNIICFAGRACNILNINITECCRCICRSYTKTDSQVFCVCRHNEILLIGVICFTCRLRLKCACLVCRQRNCRSSAICRRISGYRSWYSVVIKGKCHEVDRAGSCTHSNIHTNSVCMSGCYRYFISTCTVIRSGGSI